MGGPAWNLSDIGGFAEEGVPQREQDIDEFAWEVPEHCATSVCFYAGSYSLAVFQSKWFKNCFKNAFQMYDRYQSEKSV